MSGPRVNPPPGILLPDAAVINGNMTVWDGNSGRKVKDGGAPGGGGLAAVVDDPTPELGGDLDTLTRKISTSTVNEILVENNASPLGVRLNAQGADFRVGNDSAGGGGPIVTADASGTQFRLGLFGGFPDPYAELKGPNNARIEINKTIQAGVLIHAEGSGYIDLQTLGGSGIIVSNTVGTPSHFETLLNQDLNLTAGGTGIVNISGSSSAVLMATGTTAQRPAAPVNGMVRYNTDLDGLEFYQNQWVQVARVGVDMAAAYDVGVQVVSAASTLTDVVFGVNTVLDGWTHAAGSADFVCARTGAYLVSWALSIEKTAGGDDQAEGVLLFNGNQQPGTQFSTDLLGGNDPLTLSKTSIVECVAGQTLKLQMAGSDATTQLRGQSVAATVAPSASLDITPIGG